MIPKMTSHELNNILLTANEKVESVIDEVKTIKKDIVKKLQIARCETEYIEQQMEEIKLIHKETNTNPELAGITKIFTMPSSEPSDTYERYGCTFIPKFKSSPVNVFNIMATATGEAFFRDMAEVSINGTAREEYKDILKHDSLKDKELFFESIEGDNPEIILSVNLDRTKVFGTCNFNMIEFDPFLSGAYDIEYIRIYSQEGDKYEEYTGFTGAGRMRVILDKIHNFIKVDIKIIPKFSTTINEIKKSYIGIKHIYFYEAKLTTDSYAIFAINSNEFIDTIDDNITIKTPNKTIESTISNEGIELFLNKTIDPATGKPIFSTLQEPSKPGDTKPISLNVKTIYAKVPLKENSVTGITFSVSSKTF